MYSIYAKIGDVFELLTYRANIEVCTVVLYSTVVAEERGRMCFSWLCFLRSKR